MKKPTSSLLLSIAALIGVALTTVTAYAKSNASSEDTKPSRAIVIDDKYHYPVDQMLPSGLQDFYIETLSDAVDYLVLPKDFVRTAEIDSLLEVYNIAAAANALQADIFSLSRGLLTNDEIEKFDGSGITDKEMLQRLNKLAMALRNPYSEDNEDTYWANVDKSFGALNQAFTDKYLNDFISKIDAEDMIQALSEDRYVPDIQNLRERVKNDPTTAQELRQRLIKEEQFIPQTILAKEYALACYAYPDSVNNREVSTGVIESLLKSGNYSPILPELWRMWRCRIQMDELSRSNDGEIQNHLYNALRNQVATTLLREYSENHSNDALSTFLCIATEYNIIRTGTLVGNYATKEDMELFWSQAKQYNGQ